MLASAVQPRRIASHTDASAFLQPYIMQTLRSGGVNLVNFRILTRGWDWQGIHELGANPKRPSHAKVVASDVLGDIGSMAETLQVLSSQAFTFKSAIFEHSCQWNGRAISPLKIVYRFSASIPDANFGFMGSMTVDPVRMETGTIGAIDKRLQVILKDADRLLSLGYYKAKPELYVNRTP